MRAGAFLAALAVLLAAAYRGMAKNEAVYDDPVLIQENPGIQSLGNLPKLFTADYAEVSRYFKAYRPTSVAVHMLAYRVLGPSPNGHRSLNLLLHFLNAWLLFSICRRYFFRDSITPILAGLLFGLHSAASECILLAASLDAPLAFLFCLAAFWSYLRAREAQGASRLGWALASWSAFVLGLFSKETAALLPLAPAIWELLRVREDARPGWWRRPLFLSYFPPLLVYALIRFSLFGEYARAPYIGGTFWSNFLTSLKIIPLYARILLWPHPLSISYRIQPVQSMMEGPVLGALLILALLASLAAWLWRRDRDSLFWLAWLFWPLLAVMNWVPFFDEVMLANERHLYFSLAAFSVLLARGFALLSELPWRGAQAAVWAGVAALLISYGVATARRVPDWRDEVALHAQAASLDPENYRALNDLGWAYHKKGDFAKAEETYLKALRIFPGILTCVRLAAVYEDLGRFQDGIRFLDAVLEKSDSLALRHYKVRETMGRLLFRLGNAHLLGGRVPEAAAAYSRAVEMDPNLDGAHHNLGVILAAQGKKGEAARALREALRLNPKDEIARRELKRLGAKP